MFDDDTTGAVHFEVEVGPSQTAIAKLPGSFQFEGDSGPVAIPVRYVDPILFKTHERARAAQLSQTEARGGMGLQDPAGGYGTLGWIFTLDGVLGGLTNWHVACDRGNDTPLGQRRFLTSGGELGTLEWYEKVYRTGNIFDIAFIKLRDGVNTPDLMAACGDGTTHPAPRKLGDSGLLGHGRVFRKIGARAPTCREGRFMGVGDATINYGTEEAPVLYTFTRQLYFSRLADPGDSGSVIVDKETNHVLGLHFAGDTKPPFRHSISNPLYGIGWQYTGTRMIDGMEVPSFESTRASQTATALDTERLALSPSDLESSPLKDFFAVGQVINDPRSGWNGLNISGHLQDILAKAPSEWKTTVDTIKGDWIKVLLSGPWGDRFTVTAKQYYWVHAMTGMAYPTSGPR